MSTDENTPLNNENAATFEDSGGFEGDGGFVEGNGFDDFKATTNDESADAFGDSSNMNDANFDDGFGDNFTSVTDQQLTSADQQQGLAEQPLETAEQQFEATEQQHMTIEEDVAYRVVNEVMSSLPNVISSNPAWPGESYDS